MAHMLVYRCGGESPGEPPDPPDSQNERSSEWVRIVGRGGFGRVTLSCLVQVEVKFSSALIWMPNGVGGKARRTPRPYECVSSIFLPARALSGRATSMAQRAGWEPVGNLPHVFTPRRGPAGSESPGL